MSESTENAGQREVVVVTGAGGMGAAIARRLGGGRTVVTDLLVDGGQAGWLRWHMPAAAGH